MSPAAEPDHVGAARTHQVAIFREMTPWLERLALGALWRELKTSRRSL